MLEKPRFDVASSAYRRLGLIGNPFRPSVSDDVLEDPAQVACHAEAMHLLAALDSEAARERSRPIWVSKSEDIPDFYTRIPLAETLTVLSDNEDLDLLAAYVPFFMMRHGRIRSALEMLAEKLAMTSIGVTLAEYSKAALSDPDPELLEASGLSREEALALAERFSASPAETSAEVFGEDLTVRAEGPGVDEIVGSGGRRMSALEADPEADGEGQDATPVTEPGQPELDVEGESEPAASELPAHLVYLIEHVRTHVSPVLARGIVAYIDGGAYALSQELKITRGPRKTLAAIARFATYRFRKVVIIYDQFDSWYVAPDDLRIRIAGALAEIRMLLSTTGILVFLAGDLELTEIRDQFMGSREVPWTMAPLLEEVTPESNIPSGLVSFALSATSLTGQVPDRLADLESMAGDKDPGFLGRLGGLVDDMAVDADEPVATGDPVAVMSE